MSRASEIVEKNTDAYILIGANESKGKLLITKFSW